MNALVCQSCGACYNIVKDDGPAAKDERHGSPVVKDASPASRIAEAAANIGAKPGASSGGATGRSAGASAGASSGGYSGLGAGGGMLSGVIGAVTGRPMAGASPESYSGISWESRTYGAQRDLDNVSVYSCSSCGGQIVAEKLAMAKECPYCGSTNMTINEGAHERRPDKIIPFQISREQVKVRLAEFTRSKKLIPGDFTGKIEKVAAYYVPFWLYDCDTRIMLKYSATKDGKGYLLNRAGTAQFSNLPADGSLRFNDSQMEAIEPYDFRQLVDYDDRYFAGFMGYKQDVDEMASMKRVERRIYNTAIGLFRDSVKGYGATVSECKIGVSNIRVKYALLPVWQLSTVYNGKRFIFFMNAQTGKITGQTPISWEKVAFQFFIIIGIGFVICNFLYRLT
jgi:predicted RNA-binding Zn-ribbon protein involved in translation (DUF1610 family)